MPGITGILAKQKNPHAASLLQAMLQSMMHEPFYTSARHIDHEEGWFAGSVTFTDPMPRFSADRSLVLFLAGECYGEDGSASRHNGHKADSSRADLVLRMYEKEGPAFVARLNGLFSGVILDKNTGKCLIFTDRYGLRKLYFHEDASGFYFASEAKALLGALPALRSAAARSVAEYLCFDCVLGGHSYFPGIDCVPGAALWTVANGRVSKTSYFDPCQLENRAPLAPQSFFEQLESTFHKAVSRCLDSEKVSLALTGGLDTRLIMANLPDNCHNLTTFTLGGMYRDTMDVRIARKISRICELQHQTVRLDKSFLSDYAKHAAHSVYVSDGLADATVVDSIYLNHLARQIAPIKLTGAFGSQVLGRVKRALRYRPPTPELINGDFAPFLAAASDELLASKDEHNLTYCIHKEIPWYWSRFIVPEMSQLTIRLPFLDKDFIDLLYQAPSQGFDGSRFEVSAIAKCRTGLMDIRTNQGAGGRCPAVVSRAVKAFIRARALTEKSFNWDVLPHSLQHAAAKVDTFLLSPLHLDRLVRGWEFFRHYNFWFRRDLSPYLKEMLLDSRTLSRPYWNPKYVEKTVNDHISGRRNNLSDIRKVLTIELIHRELLKQ